MEIADLGTTCLAIVCVCLIVGMMVKNISFIDDKWIPCIVAFVGAMLALLGFYTLENFAADWLSAVQIGIASGLASTGLHQIVKQLGAAYTTTEDEKEEK